MSANQAVFSSATMARVLGVSKAGHYAWLRRPPSAHTVANPTLNARPRKTLAWKTPAEMLDEALQSAHAAVATTA